MLILAIRDQAPPVYSAMTFWKSLDQENCWVQGKGPFSNYSDIDFEMCDQLTSCTYQTLPCDQVTVVL